MGTKARKLVTKYPYAFNGVKRMIDGLSAPSNPHEWQVRRVFWTCRKCGAKVDGSLSGSRHLLFTECSCTEA